MKGRVITSDEREFKMHQCIYYLSPKKSKGPERSFIFDEKIKNPPKMSQKVIFWEYSTHFFQILLSGKKTFGCLPDVIDELDHFF